MNFAIQLTYQAVVWEGISQYSTDLPRLILRFILKLYPQIVLDPIKSPQQKLNWNH